MIANKLNIKYHQYMSERGVVHILVLLILIAAIIAGIYLATHPQIFRSRANDKNSWMQNFKITDSKGQILKCDTVSDPPICYTPTEEINVTWQGADSELKK